jgi:flagellar biosynthesis protein
MKSKEPQKAVALRYAHGQDPAPKVVAKGRGKVAKKIVALAREHQVPLVEDKQLVNLLETLDIDSDIPESLYQAVAEVLVFIYRLNQSQR